MIAMYFAMYLVHDCNVFCNVFGTWFKKKEKKLQISAHAGRATTAGVVQAGTWASLQADRPTTARGGRTAGLAGLTKVGGRKQPMLLLLLVEVLAQAVVCVVGGAGGGGEGAAVAVAVEAVAGRGEGRWAGAVVDEAQLVQAQAEVEDLAARCGHGLDAGGGVGLDQRCVMPFK